MKTKMEVTLSEKDALQDMLDAEKLLMSYYNVALTEGSCKPFRKEIMKHYAAHADTQFSVYETMLARGYYETKPAEKQLVDQSTDKFSKSLKQIRA
ncbi:MAG: spore coat protein [Clostridia bacterium]|nr:spore coat protein [Clostridia bacterium]